MTANGGVVVDNITIDGNEIDVGSGDLTLDVAGDIILDAGGNEIKLKTGGTEWGQIYNSSSNLAIFSSVSDKDLIFQGNDGGSIITALSLDMSDAGTATFNHDIKMAASSQIIGAGDLSFDSADDLFNFTRAGGNARGRLESNDADFSMKCTLNNGDLIFKGVDGGTNITALTLDMSNAGAASFNSTIAATSATFTPSSGEEVVLTRDGAGPYFGNSSNHSLRLITNNAARLTIANNGVSTFSSTVTSTGLIANVPTNTGLTINSADVSAIQFNVAAGNQKNWGFASTLVAAGDFGLYQSTSNGGNPITAGAAKLYVTATGTVIIGGTTDAVHGNVDDLQIGNGVGHAGIGIHSANDANGAIFFSDPNSTLSGQIEYVHNGDYMTFVTGTSTRARIDSDGLKFGGDSATANALGDYEEGTWSPTSGVNLTLNTACKYIKIGNHITYTFDVTFASQSDGNSARLQSLPYDLTTYNSGFCGWQNAGVVVKFHCHGDDANIYNGTSNSILTYANLSGERLIGTITGIVS